MMRKIVKMVKIVSKLQMVFNMLKWCSLFSYRGKRPLYPRFCLSGCYTRIFNKIAKILTILILLENVVTTFSCLATS